MRARSLALVAVLALAGAGAQAQEVPAESQVLLQEPEATPVEEIPQAPAAMADAPTLREVDRGIASWYGGHFHGRRTASGERFDMHALTAAHPTLPFGTLVRVRSLVNGREVDVRINDRGPHIKQRVIDLSRAAAQALGLLQSGLGTKPVLVSLIGSGDGTPTVVSKPRRPAIRKLR